METGFALREVFNAKMLEEMATRLLRVYPAFNFHGFMDQVLAELEYQSFGGRCQLIRQALTDFLPPSFPPAVEILVKSLGPPLGAPELVGYEGFYVMPMTSYVAHHGLGHFELSLAALYQMTMRFSAEGDIRPFLQRYEAQTLELLHQWTQDPNVHVRRLVSEGTRPRLPLCSRLPQYQKDPSPVLALLEKLKADPELYVRRSVANNLNDISKDNPQVVVETLTQWSRSQDPNTKWLVRHAARSLLKAGNQGVLELLGYSLNPQVQVEISLSQARLKLGQTQEIHGVIHSLSKKSQKIHLDYVVHFTKAKGQQAAKVFKWKAFTLKAGETLRLVKTQTFKPLSTRKLYPGPHDIELQVNGQRMGRAAFVLEC